ncbi:unnamed protein product, partial [Symbiodinium sp. KB8]
MRGVDPQILEDTAGVFSIKAVNYDPGARVHVLWLHGYTDWPVSSQVSQELKNRSKWIANEVAGGLRKEANAPAMFVKRLKQLRAEKVVVEASKKQESEALRNKMDRINTAKEKFQAFIDEVNEARHQVQADVQKDREKQVADVATRQPLTNAKLIEHPEILNGRLLKIPLDGMASRKRVVSLQNPLSDEELVAETTEAEVCIARFESQIGSASGEKGVGAVSLSAKASYADQNKYEITRRKNQDIRELVKMKVDAEISGVSLIHSEDLALLPAVEGKLLAMAAKQGDMRTKALGMFLETYGSHVCSHVVVGGVCKTKQSFQASVEVGSIVVQEAAHHQFATSASAAGEFVGMNGVGKAGGCVDLKTDDSYGRQVRGDTWGSMVQDLFQVWARRYLNLPKSIGSFDSQDRLEEQLNKELDKQRAAMIKVEDCDRMAGEKGDSCMLARQRLLLRYQQLLNAALEETLVWLRTGRHAIAFNAATMENNVWGEIARQASHGEGIVSSNSAASSPPVVTVNAANVLGTGAAFSGVVVSSFDDYQDEVELATATAVTIVLDLYLASGSRPLWWSTVISAIFVESTMMAATEGEKAAKAQRLADEKLWVTRIATLLRVIMQHADPDWDRYGRLSENIDSILSISLSRQEFDEVVQDEAAAKALDDLDICREDHAYLSNILDPDNSE